MNNTVLQAVAHRRASTAIFEAMKWAAAAPTHRAQFGDEELVVGSSGQDGTTVYVSEYVSNIRRAARGQILRRLPRIVLLVLVTAIVVNLVFLRMAARPLRKLVEAVRRIGQGEFGLQTGPFRSEEFDYLAGAVNTMSAALAENENRRRSEMDRAGNIQQQLLPGEVDVPGLRLAHFYRPAEDVAGDYLDIIALPGGDCLVAVADVTGHGVPAALSATMLKAYLQDASEHHRDPSDILRFLNHRLTGVAPTENFATMFVAVVDSDRSTLRYASAGHDPGLLMRANGSVTELPSTGLVLGILDDADWSTEILTVGQHDRLLLTTDGVTEAFSPAGKLFGRERLADEFMASASQAIEECSKQIRHAID
jgi:sigma-B regulation protein RsbU (phosphoserine phosphatase)